MRPPLPPPEDSVGGPRVVTPDSPFSVEDMTSDSIFYVQDGQRKAQASQDVFSLYISNGHSQTEAFRVEIDIQVGNVKQPSWLILLFSVLLLKSCIHAVSQSVGNGEPSACGSVTYICLLPSLQSKEKREPVVSVSSIHVEENSGVVITNSSLRVLGHDTPENEIVLTVIRKPSYGENACLRWKKVTRIMSQ